MKRLKKVTQLIVVWVSVCLLSVDPASACRLLGNRRCCCCCPCPPADCGAEKGVSGQVPMASGQEQLPSDLPAGVTTDVAIGPAAPLASPSTPVSPSRSAADDFGTGRDAAEAIIVDVRVHSPATVAPPSRTIVEPATEPAITTQTTPRQPAGAAPSAVTEAAVPPRAEFSAARQAENAELTSQPAGLAQRQPIDSVATPMPIASEPGSRQPAVPETGSIARPGDRRQETVDRGQGTAAVRGGSRTPARPGSIAPTSPVTPPAFPAVSDDPFTPLAPATAAPTTTQPQNDDPFAPLNPAPAVEPKPVAPIAAEPAMKLHNTLLPDADGRLPVRDWTDNSGQFRVKARLISILDGKVRLLKETGRTTTVPVERLSTDDRAYVDQIIGRYGKDLAGLRLASR